MAESRELRDFVPLCTAAEGPERDLRLRGAGIDLLESARHADRKIALVSVLHDEFDQRADAPEFSGERGIYISALAVGNNEQDASVFVCVLRRVELSSEPFWGSMLLLLSSHVVVARTGPLHSASFQSLAFLSDFLQIQVLESSSGGDEHNATLLKEFVPSLTWVAIDLKIKDMEGNESPSKYFEQKLTTPSKHGVDEEAQMLTAAFVHTRDCLVIKSNTLQTPPGFAFPQAFTSPKAMTHAIDKAQLKPFFGRFLTGGLVLHLCRSIVHAVSAQSKMVIQRIVNNVQLNYWKLLLGTALKAYSDTMHARVAVYDHVEFTTEYLLDITERKMQTQQVAVVSAGQGNFSAFDEFGNLKRHQSTANMNLAAQESAPIGLPTSTSLNTGIFTFLKDRAERAFTKQFSIMTNTASHAAPPPIGTDLSFIPEDEEAERETLGKATVETPADVLDRCNSRFKNYTVPIQYMNTKSESMPMDGNTLNSIHEEALKAVNDILRPFLFDLRCSNVKLSELASSVNFQIGEKNLFHRVGAIKKRFETANDVASALFCAGLIQYLHAIVLRKNEKDTEAQQQSFPRLNRSATSVMLLSDPNSKDAQAPLTKLPLELLAYKTNLEAMVSQYNFVARGPLSTKILLGFFDGPVRQRLTALTQKEYNRFDQACGMKENKIAQLEETLEDKQRQLHQIHKMSAEQSLQEAQAVAEIQAVHEEQLAKLNSSIRSATDMVERAMRDQQSLYQSTMQATRKTINTIDQVAVKNRVSMGYLERFEKGRLFSKSWRQFYYVLDHATLKCYKSKSEFEERKPPCEPPVCLTGYTVVKSRTDDMKIKVIPPEAGQILRFRAPASVGRETWMKRFIEATQSS